MSDSAFAQFYPQSAAFEPQAYHKLDAAAPPSIALDSTENQKQSFDFFNYSQSGLDVVAPHPDQFELELDDSLAAFDADLNVFPIDTTDLNTFYHSTTPAFGPPSSFTVSTESVSAYDSAYNDNLSSRSESFYNLNIQSPTSNYPSSVYSLTQEQFDMDFQRMGMPTDDPTSFGALPASPSLRGSPGGIPNISQYSPAFSSPRGSFSDYEPAQPQQVRLGSSAASDYYPHAQMQLHKYGNPARVVQQPPQARSTASVSPQLSAMSHPSVVSHPSLAAHRAKMDSMHDDPKRKYQCPTCPRAFARAYNLKTHIQTHDPNRLKPYACHHKSCGRAFSRKHDLTRHMVSIHRAESVTSLSTNPSRAIGVDSGRRAWCEQCGRSWVGKGKEKGCECDDVK